MSISISYSSQPPVPENISRLLTLQYCFLVCTASIQIDTGQIPLIYCVSLIQYILLCKTKRVPLSEATEKRHVRHQNTPRVEESSMKKKFFLKTRNLHLFAIQWLPKQEVAYSFLTALSGLYIHKLVILLFENVWSFRINVLWQGDSQFKPMLYEATLVSTSCLFLWKILSFPPLSPTMPA